MALTTLSILTRLAQYGLTEADAFSQPLVVPQGKSLLLSAPASGQKKAYATLKPKTIEDVKRWIGVPNSVGKRRSFNSENPSDLALANTPAAFAALTKPQRQSLRTLAKQYVYGDSSGLAHFNNALSQILVNSKINGLFLMADIDVLPDAELKLAANLKVLFANNIRIWKGGSIRILGDTKIDCASIIGEYTTIKFPIVVRPSLGLGVLSNFGG